MNQSAAKAGHTPGEHTEFPWCIPTGDQNGFIICAGDDPEKPGPILMVVSAPRGRDRVLTDADINDNTAFMVRAAQCHADLVKALEEIDTLAVCTGVVNPAQHRNMLENIARIARAALSRATPSRTPAERSAT